MDKAAMQTSVAVLQRMDIYEPKSGACCLQNSINSVIAHAGVSVYQAFRQAVQVIRSRADELGQRLVLMIPLTKKNPIWPKAWVDEPGVFDEDAM